MERANGISEMDDDMTDSILDYHSELEKLGYKIINEEDRSGSISDSNGKNIVIWDQDTHEYKWAGKPWTWSPFDWPDLEKEVYLKFKDKEKEKVTTMEEINETTIKSYATDNNFSGKKNIETVKELKAKLIKQGILQEEDDLYLITEAEAKKNRTKIKNEDNKITIYIPIENENSEKQEYRTETYYPIQDTTNYKKLIENKIKSKTKNEENKTVEYSENKDNYTLKIPYSVTINNSELTPQEYTKDIFEMLKKINSIPEEDLKIGKKKINNILKLH